MGNIKRSRGYNFEYDLVKGLTAAGMKARRLGGASTGLPDVVATHKETSTIFTIECKSVKRNIAYIPDDEIIRCVDILDMFSVYANLYVVFAFKFPAINKNEVVMESGKPQKPRKLRYWFVKVHVGDKILDDLRENVKSVACNYNGVFTLQVKEGHTRKGGTVYKMLNSIEGLAELPKDRAFVPYLATLRE